MWSMTVKRRVQESLVSRHLSCVQWRLVSVGLQYQTCYTSPCWHIEFWGGSHIFYKFVHTCYEVTTDLNISDGRADEKCTCLCMSIYLTYIFIKVWLLIPTTLLNPTLHFLMFTIIKCLNTETCLVLFVKLWKYPQCSNTASDEENTNYD
jgi:hypothetical protein